MSKPLLLLASIIGLSGCQSTASEAKPAVLTSNSAANSAAVKTALSELMFGREVKVAQTAFTTSDKLVIERQPTKYDNGGIVRTEPEDVWTFSLVQIKGHCWLQREDNGQRIALTNVTCKPLNN